MNNLANFVKSLSQLYDIPCWGYALHSTSQRQRIGLAFGTKTPRPTVLDENDIFSDELRQYIPQFTLFTQFCSWRFEDENQIMCTNNDERVHQALEAINGQQVQFVRLSKPALDMIVQFESTICLRLFCVAPSVGAQSINYQLYTPDCCYNIMAGNIQQTSIDSSTIGKE